MIHDDLNYATHQVITTQDHSQTTIVRAGSFNSQREAVNEATIELPNAILAIDFQKSLINQDLGKYDAINNSCLSHVCDVLENGGASSINKHPISYAKFLKKKGFKKITK